MHIFAPFTEEQVKALNKFQNLGYWHEFTCLCGAILIATENGWTCPDCFYTQNWAFDYMADEKQHPENPFDALMKLVNEVDEIDKIKEDA